MWVLWWQLGLLLALLFMGNDLDSCPQANPRFGPCRAASLCNYQLRIKGLCAGRWACGGREDNYSQIKQQCLGRNQQIIHSQWAQRSHTKAHTPLKQELCHKSSAGSIWGQTALLLAQPDVGSSCLSMQWIYCILLLFPFSCGHVLFVWHSHACSGLCLLQSKRIREEGVILTSQPAAISDSLWRVDSCSFFLTFLSIACLLFPLL